MTSTPIAPGTTYNVFVSVNKVVDSLANAPASLDYGLVSITNATQKLPFTMVLLSPGVQEIDQFQISVPAAVLTSSVTLTWTNFSTNLPVVTQPYFPNAMADQSVLMAASVTFDSPAVHTSGYQWQHDGTNLVEGAHFIGVTTSALTIAGAQASDSGNYSVIASHPLNPATNSATLFVYKPIVLSLGRDPSAGGFTLTVANQDGTPLEADFLPTFSVYSATNLLLDSAWNFVTNTGTLNDGVLQIELPKDAGSAGRFWRVLED